VEGGKEPVSKEVDERVVEMRFDNAKFEKNTRQTMKTLQELNESLKLEGAEKGFEKIEDASAKVDFDKMQGAVEGLSSKFSALEVMGVTALVRITNQAIDTGEKLVKSLSIDQVTSGWNKYAQKTASVQTIMNATGKSITKVNSYLDKLMWYSDETSYGFTDMTASLGQLTAAGGDIDKLIPMIMGIANATAYAGKGASEFSRVIYNLNQSYSQGYLSLMDWKSVELAGVATAELKQLLIDTAVEQGKLKKGAVNVGSFGSTLSKKWADMEAGFGKLAEFTMAVKNLQESNPKQYSTAAKAIEALEDKYDEVTVKAFKAAQEAKSFTEAVDATKDAVSSGWMETFDILFGNYEEAKGFWSDLADEFWDIFAGGQDARNNWLRSAFDSGLDQMLGTEGFSDATDNYTNLLQKSLIKTGVLTEDAVTEAGSFQKALEESSVTAEQLASVVQDAAAYYGEIAALSDKELKAKGYDRTKVDALAKAYASMVEKIQNGNVSLDDFSGKMNQLSGREHLFNGILNILEGINSVLQPMRDAFGEVFMMDGSPLYNLLKGFD
jgi:tape measure domain-containing protein